MKIDPKHSVPLVRAKAKPKPRPREAKSKKSEFTLACEAAGKHPTTVRRRMRPRSEGGQGMSLEEALVAPVLSRQQVGCKARQANRYWGLTGETL